MKLLQKTKSGKSGTGFTLIELPSLRTRLRRTQAFTLIELLVVISVIGLLASVILVSLNSARQKARVSKRITDLAQIRKALEFYYDDNGSYPNTDYPNIGNARSQCAGSGQAWETGSLSADQVVKDINNNKTLVPTYIASFPSDPSMNPSTNANCYWYFSNGTDYKLLDHNMTDMTLAQIDANLNYKDPARNDYALQPPCNMNDTNYALAVYSSGARCW